MAIGAQFLTAIAAFLGTAFGLFSGQIIQGLGHEILIPFTAWGKGEFNNLYWFYLVLWPNSSVIVEGFLYLACVTILPDVLETDVGWMMRLLQVAAVVAGVSFMYIVAELEEMEAAGDNDTLGSHIELWR